MLNSNATCQVRKVTGTDVYGKPKFGAPVTERCAVVKLKAQIVHTTVRADSSQSRGHGDEFVSTNTVLLSGKTAAALGDQLIVRGHLILITAMHDRLDVGGIVDHYEIGGEQWA